MKKEVKTVKTLQDLKKQYGKDLSGIKDFNDLKDLASNFIRMITWKKVKDLEFISNNYVSVRSSIIKDILINGYDEALKAIKQDNLHKAYNLVYIYDYYGLDFKEENKKIKENKMKVLG